MTDLVSNTADLTPTWWRKRPVGSVAKVASICSRFRWFFGVTINADRVSMESRIPVGRDVANEIATVRYEIEILDDKDDLMPESRFA